MCIHNGDFSQYILLLLHLRWHYNNIIDFFSFLSDWMKNALFPFSVCAMQEHVSHITPSVGWHQGWLVLSVIKDELRGRRLRLTARHKQRQTGRSFTSIRLRMWELSVSYTQGQGWTVTRETGRQDDNRNKHVNRNTKKAKSKTTQVRTQHVPPVT